MTQRRWRGRLAVTFVALSLLLAACGGGGDPGDDAVAPKEKLTKVTFLSGRPAAHVQQAYIYVPMELGYFADEGLDVTSEYTGGSTEALQLLLGDKGFIANPNSSTLLDAAGKNLDLIGVYQRTYGSPFAFVVPEDSPLTEFSADQLKGKTIGISEFAGGEVPLLRAALREIGLKEGKNVTLLPIGGGDAAALNAINEDRVQMYASALPDMATLASAGFTYRDLTPSSHRTFPGNAFTVRPQDLKDNPDQVVGFLRAVAKGNLFMQTNLAAALEISKKYAPESFQEEGFAENFMKGLFPLDVPPDSIKEIGAFDMAGWQQYQDFLTSGLAGEDAIAEKVDVTKVLDDSLIAKINDFDHDSVLTEAREFGSS
jgi:NitT/TauT family transport system substrate-binding protein